MFIVYSLWLFFLLYHLTMNKVVYKSMQKVPALHWEIWSDRVSRQRSMYILVNHWTAITWLAVIVSKIVKRVVSHIIFTSCSKCLLPARTQASRRWCHVAYHTFKEQCDSDCSRVLDASSQFVDILDFSKRWRRTFRACYVKMT